MQTAIPFPFVCPESFLLQEAEKLADRFSFQLSEVIPQTGLYLLFDHQRLSLCQAGHKSRVWVDFVSGRLDYRRQKGGGELISKAVNIKQNHQIWDFTAGLGRDAFVLASLGAEITLFERNPVVVALLEDGIRRAQEIKELKPIMENIRLFFFDVLKQTIDVSVFGTLPEVIYLDPMYPEQKRTSAVKKEMAYFHQLVGHNEDADQLLPVAMSLARKRVVVKRPRLGTALNQTEPDYVYTGKSTRFDVYMPDYVKDKDFINEKIL